MSGAQTTIAGAIMAVGMLLSIPLVALSGKYLNRQKFVPILLIAIGANVLGLLILFFGGLFGVSGLGQIILLVIGTFLVGGGYMGLYQALMTWVKNLFPEDMRSQFEGIRMIFYVAIPMFLGTFVGNLIIKFLGTPITLSYETGDVAGFAPNYWLFIVGAGLATLTLIPIFLARRELSKQKTTI